ncbi:lysylphosphatidylglycerol synthase transmembrane domain-containing protein [Paractinoplanes globisporus]|uniref:YbhN family protein n=1 Tax=Paractinoplanes globisporus TaxID=113565 RepID=A0ABW6WVA7_9ACTN|nr:lysylphosphatidylglycerol synthase transmembrane domain-containing protein [Actinoplanes globisporus]
MAPLRSELRPGPAAPQASRRSWWRRLRLPLLLAAGLALAALGLWGRLPDPHAFLGALTGADYWWVTLAAALQVTSLAAFGWQQRVLLRSLGVRLTARRAAAVTLARTAISIAMPAGAAVSAAYAVKEYQRGGVSKEHSAASMIVSGLASIGGLTLLYVTGGVAVLGRNPALLLRPEPLAIVGGLAVLTTGAVIAGRRVPSFAAAIRGNGRVLTWIRRTLASAQQAWQAGASLRARDWTAAVLLFAVNWLTDLLCLAATCRAVGLPTGVVTLAGIYLGVQIVRQVPLTPGGVGVVDTALVAGLTAAGATAVSAAAAVLIYRLISCWLLLPAGGVAALALRRGGATGVRARTPAT